MSTMQPGVNAYQQTAIESTPPDKLLLMLYDGAIRFLNQAKNSMTNTDFVTANTNLLKAQDIITELMVTLNMDYDISKNLYSLYEYFNYRLVQANIRKNVEPVDEVLAHLVDLRTAWAQAAILVKQGNGSAGGLDFAG